MKQLGTMYLYGVGLPRDYANAFAVVRALRPEHGNPPPTYETTVMADIGWVRRAIRRSARACIAKAAEYGFTRLRGTGERRPRESIRRRSRPRRGVRVVQVALQPSGPRASDHGAVQDRRLRAPGRRRRDEGPLRASQLAALIQHPWSLRSTRSSKAVGSQSCRI